MPAQKRIKTDYVGVTYIVGTAVATGRPECIYYIRYRRGGKMVEEKAGRQFQNGMTPARASAIRAERFQGKAPSNKEKREAERAAKLAAANRWSMSRLWEEYKSQRTMNKALDTDDDRFRLHLAPSFGDKTPAEIITLDLDRLRVRMLKTHKPQTVKHVLALFKRITRFGVKKGLCPEIEPSRLHIEMPHVDNKVTEDLDAEEQALADFLKFS